MATNVVIVGPFRLLCEAMTLLLNEVEGLAATYVWEDMPLAYPRILDQHPDVVVVDIHSGAEEMLGLAVRLATDGKQKVLVVGPGPCNEVPRNAVAAYSGAGARGCTASLATLADLVPIIREVSRGEMAMPIQALEDLFKQAERSELRPKSLADSRSSAAPGSRLDPEERS